MAAEASVVQQGMGQCDLRRRCQLNGSASGSSGMQ